MDGAIRLWSLFLSVPIGLALGQGQQCYFGAGQEFRAPSSVIPCYSDGPSACCMQGDTCLSGNACYNYDTGNTYQYGCTDITFTDPTCPYKCGWDPKKSPWVALEYCDADGVDDTWVCHSPESCGCSWPPTAQLLALPIRGCAAMGSDARAALYAPNALVPWVSLPKQPGGSTGYYKTTTSNGKLTWTSTAVDGYTPSSIGPYVTYAKAAPTTTQILFPGSTPDPSTLGSAHLLNGGVIETITFPSGLSSSSSAPYSSPPTSTPGTTGATSPNTPTRTEASVASNGGPGSTSSSAPTQTSAPGGLTTGAKVGIGVGVAGGVCLLAAVALVTLIFRRRRGRSNVSNGTGPDEKYASWSSQPYPPGGSPHGYHYNQSYQYQGVPAMIHEATYSPEDERTVQKRMSPPQVVPPVEMEGEHVVPEMESRSRRIYGETSGGKQQ